MFVSIKKLFNNINGIFNLNYIENNSTFINGIFNNTNEENDKKFNLLFGRKLKSTKDYQLISYARFKHSKNLKTLTDNKTRAGLGLHYESNKLISNFEGLLNPFEITDTKKFKTNMIVKLNKKLHVGVNSEYYLTKNTKILFKTLDFAALYKNNNYMCISIDYMFLV